jgi:hypothetical protein
VLAGADREGPSRGLWVRPYYIVATVACGRYGPLIDESAEIGKRGADHAERRVQYEVGVVAGGKFRHGDHRFEWTRAQFEEWATRRATRLADLERFGFNVVAEDPPREVVIGLMGKFWTPTGALCDRVSIDDFRRSPPAGLALAGWNFSVERVSATECLVRTETRVLCAPDARTKFRLYWMVIRPGSGVIRRSMLAAIKRTAEDS